MSSKRSLKACNRISSRNPVSNSPNGTVIYTHNRITTLTEQTQNTNNFNYPDNQPHICCKYPSRSSRVTVKATPRQPWWRSAWIAMSAFQWLTPLTTTLSGAEIRPDVQIHFQHRRPRVKWAGSAMCEILLQAIPIYCIHAGTWRIMGVVRQRTPWPKKIHDFELCWFNDKGPPEGTTVPPSLGESELAALRLTHWSNW